MAANMGQNQTMQQLIPQEYYMLQQQQQQHIPQMNMHSIPSGTQMNTAQVNLFF